MERRVRVIPATAAETHGGSGHRRNLRVAAYCRVSTDEEEQLSSYEAQKDYYTQYIRSHEGWRLVRIYADQGITGTSTKKRTEFNQMIAACRRGKIDLILTKSLSRFARNTVDCLDTVRELKGLGIGVLFEKENSLHNIAARRYHRSHNCCIIHQEPPHRLSKIEKHKMAS